MESEAFMTSMQREVNNNNESQLLLTNQHTSITISMENQIDTLGGKIIETMDQSKLQLQQNIGTWGKNVSHNGDTKPPLHNSYLYSHLASRHSTFGWWILFPVYNY